MKKGLKSVLVSTAVLALVFTMATAARAEEEEEMMMEGATPHLDLGIFVGAMTFDDVVDSQNGPVFGIRAGYDIDHHWGIEFVAAWQESNLESSSKFNRDHKMAAGSVIYNFRFDGDQVVVPFVGGGLGGWQEDTDNKPKQNEFLLHAVVGLRFDVAEHISLLIDGREWFVPYYNPYKGKNVEANNESVQLHFAYRF